MASATAEGRLCAGADVPLPGLGGFPTVSSGGVVNSAHEERNDAIRRAAERVRARREFHDACASFTPERRAGERITEVRVTFRVDRVHCSALVEWISGGMGGRRVVRRIGGPLTVDSRSVRGLGGGVGLLALMRSLTKVLDD